MLDETILKLSEKYGSEIAFKVYTGFISTYAQKNKHSNLSAQSFDDKMYKTFTRYANLNYFKK
jgi:hypothetical protein